MENAYILKLYVNNFISFFNYGGKKFGENVNWSGVLYGGRK